MPRIALEWGLAAMVFALAALARYQLVEPPEIAQACEMATPWWCTVRDLVIRTFATWGLGHAAIAATILTLLTWHRLAALAAVLVGAAGLVLYCYEPAAVGFVTGALVLARAQSGHRLPSSGREHDGTESRA